MAVPAVASFPRLGSAADGGEIYDLKPFGNARVLYMADTPAQLLPLYFREPSVNIGAGSVRGRLLHLVGDGFLKKFGIAPDSAEAYAFTFLDFEAQAGRRGKVGGFAHLKTLVDMLRSAVPSGRSLLLDGGDLWQSGGLANFSKGADMVEAANRLGIEAMTGHFEFTYGEEALRRNLGNFKGSSSRKTCF